MYVGQNEFFRFSGVGQNDLEAFYRILYISFDKAIATITDSIKAFFKS